MLELLISVPEREEIELNSKFKIGDFELASINALQRTFPNAKAIRCFFFILVKTYIEVLRRMVSRISTKIMKMWP